MWHGAKRTVIKFYYKLRKTATEVFEDLKEMYGDNCLSRAQVFRWFSTFKNGRESLKDEHRTGQPVSVRTNEIVVKARLLPMTDE